MQSPIFISIEANIGAGKSTILQKLQQILDPIYATCIQEPIDYWENFRDPISNHSLLELYYKDPPKYAFPLQTMIYSSLDRVLQQTIESDELARTPNHLIISERSLQSSHHIFAKMLRDSGIMSPIEYQIYKNCIANNPIPLNMCIYLRTEPEVCYERIHHRNRQGEQRILLDYLRTCHAAHEKWVASLSADTHLRVIEVGTKTPDKIVAEVLNILADLTHI